MEAKENVKIQNENQTLASITFQNYFRMYQKLSGMTGTADTEAYEFQQIYNLEVVVIPTNKPMRRIDEPDLVYLSQQDKYEAIILDIKNCIQRKQPVLVGTASIEASELLSNLLVKAKIPHQVLNAKFHEKEAQIIAEAGQPGAVTIATNMAGRGTDIVLGGSLKHSLPETATEEERKKAEEDWQIRHDRVLEAGGLRIIGSERHESRRIDNQLRGRSGRQGDIGSSRFYLSLDDNLMRIFASERVASMMRRLGMKPGEPIEHSLVTKAIENAQRKLEGHHFDIRKQLLEYDNVANNQRRVIYSQRATIMSVDNLKEIVQEMQKEVISNLIDAHIPPQSMEDQWDLPGLTQRLLNDFQMNADVEKWMEDDQSIQPEQIKERIYNVSLDRYYDKERQVGTEIMSQFAKSIILQTLDNHWREHLAAMDCLRQGIHLRGYAQKDPKQEYKREAFVLFTEMLDSMKYDITRLVLSLELQGAGDVGLIEDQRRAEQVQSMQFLHADDLNLLENSEEDQETPVTFRRTENKIGRNDPCPCGSNKKYKNCHGRLA
jgi:preprotein translocase subunit SecA